MSDQTIVAGTGTALTSNSFTYSGYSFTGWNTVAGGTGTTYSDAEVVTINTDIDLYAQWSSTPTHSVTYTAGGGSGSVPTQSALASGATFTTGSGSGLSRSSYTFAGWSCNSGSTISAGTVVTMTAAAMTCVAQWTANSSSSSGSSGGGATSSPGKSGSTPSATKKTAIATLVTVATTPVKAPVVVVTSTPGNSGNTPSATASTTPTRSADQAPISVANTKLSQTTTLSTIQTNPIAYKGNGVSGVSVKNEEVSVAAKPGFSGKTVVTITVATDAENSLITANVIVLPLPVTNPVVKPVTEDKSRITWIRSPNAIGYEVIQDGRVICTTTKVTCTVPVLINPEAKVEIKALGRDQTESLLKEAKYVEIAVTKVVPDIALVVNFDTAKYNLDAGDKALIRAFASDVVKYGFTNIDISGHTDSRGGIDNNVLSNNRAKVSRDYLLSLLPTLKVTINGFADAINVATNGTAEGMAANRRAEFRVVG